VSSEELSNHRKPPVFGPVTATFATLFMTPREAELTRQLEVALSALSGMEALRRENQLLRQKLDQITRRFFGVSSEQLPSNQLELVLALPEVEVEVRPGKIEPGPSVEKKTPRPVRKARVPEHLPVVEEVLEPEGVKAAPEQWRRIGEEVSEQLDYEPGRFFRRRLVRPRYVQRAEPEAAPVIAPLPERLLERSLPAPGLLAHILVSKYCDHLPLYRQERIYATRHGVELPRQTLARWVGLAADWLKPIYDMILTGVMAGGYVQVDETPIEYLDPGRGKTGQGYLWTCLRPGGDVVFRWETSRAAKCLDNLLPVDFSGVLQCDGYAAYGSFARRHPHPLTLAGCWAHVRRKFYEGRNESPSWAGWVLRQIQHLYRLEAVLRQNRAGPRLREALRSSESRMIVERLGRVLEKMQPKTFPTSLLGDAIDFARGQWPRLLVFLTDGRVEIDNNQIENAIRPTALGKNYAEIRIMRSTAAELVMNGLDCSIDGWLRKGCVCAISLWVFAKHHDSKTIPSPLRSTSDGRQPSGHNPGAVRSRFADTRLCGVDCSVLRAGHRTFLPLAR